MSPLAWAHLPAKPYPERTVKSETSFDQCARLLLGELPPLSFMKARGHLARARRAAVLEPEIKALSDAALRSRLRRVARICWEDGRQADVALALVREAATRSLGIRPYDAQLMGASCLFDGQMAEMQTGEGKTLTAGLAAAIAACAGVPVHVITVNDYLAQRDAQTLSALFSYLGLRTGTIISGMSAGERRASYDCDVVYCTGKELVFDYLKDRAANGAALNQAQLRLARLLGEPRSEPLLRGLHYGIVDEADSVLIDEARTPLILSESAGPTAATALLDQAIELAAAMKQGEHFELHHGRRQLHLLAPGRLWLTEHSVMLGGEWAIRHAREHWALQALRAAYLFRRDEHYVVKDGKVLIVDENTGRALPGRTWEHGLHQLIERREGCELSDESRTAARITYQRFFARYLRLAGMTGTAREAGQELRRDYRLDTVVIPTHRPSMRRQLPTLCVGTEAEKWDWCADCALEIVRAGRAILIGTGSVAASERLSNLLRRRGVPHSVLNAVQDEQEAQLVAQAGQPGRITVATNMAGRGTDIQLAPEVRQRGGLHVILTEFHESRRIDRQLFGRAARQGDPGSGQAVVSLEDPLFARRAGAWLPLFKSAVASGSLGATYAAEVLRQRAQHSAERLYRRVRKHAVREDERLETSLAYAGRY